MPSRSEEVLQALFAALSGLNAKVVRNEGLSITIPGLASMGAVVLHDGDPGTPETTLSPLTYHYEHAAEIDVLVQGGDTNEKFDTLKMAVGTALLADRTLGGLIDWLEPSAPKPAELPELGVAVIKAATIIVTLHYASSTPLT